jgi:hypothetical protein
LYYLGSAKQSSDYETTTKYLINYIVKTFVYRNNIGQALRELGYSDPDSSWRPTMQQSTHPSNDPADKAQRAFKNKKFEFKFKSEFDFVSKDKLWTIISQKLLHFCGSIAPRA